MPAQPPPPTTSAESGLRLGQWPAGVSRCPGPGNPQPSQGDKGGLRAHSPIRAWGPADQISPRTNGANLADCCPPKSGHRPRPPTRRQVQELEHLAEAGRGIHKMQQEKAAIDQVEGIARQAGRSGARLREGGVGNSLSFAKVAALLELSR